VTGETETRLTGEAGAQVAEEIDIGVPDDFGAQGRRIRHARAEASAHRA